MSPSATRISGAAKHSAKTAESKSAPKKVVPPSKKAARAVAHPAERTRAAAKPVRTASAAAKPIREPEPKVMSNPAKETVPVKKSSVVAVEKPKKKKEGVPPEEKLEHAPKTKAIKADGDAAATAKSAAKTVKAAKVEPVAIDEVPKSGRGRKPSGEVKEKPAREKTVRAPKTKPRDPIHEFLADDLPTADEIEEDDVVIPEDLSELDPLDLPLALLDPDLLEVPRPVGPPRPKPKPRVERQPKQCASCKGMFAWLSVDRICFNCLKKKLAAKKREDEAYGGFTPEPEEDDGD